LRSQACVDPRYNTLSGGFFVSSGTIYLAGKKKSLVDRILLQGEKSFGNYQLTLMRFVSRVAKKKGVIDLYIELRTTEKSTPTP